MKTFKYLTRLETHVVYRMQRPLRYTAQKMKFSIKDSFSKSDQICSFLWIWSHLKRKSLIEYFIFCTVPDIKFRFTCGDSRLY